MHYAKRYKREINRLKRIIDECYHAVYHLKSDIHFGSGGVYGGLSRLEGNEERPVINDIKELKERIDALPLIDPGMLIEE